MRRCEYLWLPARLVLIAIAGVVGFVVGPIVEAVQEWLREREEHPDDATP